MKKDEGTVCTSHVTDTTKMIVKAVISFLTLVMPVTLAKRVVALVLHALGMPIPLVMKLVGICERTARAHWGQVAFGPVRFAGIFVCLSIRPDTE